MLATEIGKHLHEVMGWGGPMTDRQYGAWMAFLRWKNDPDYVEGLDMNAPGPDGKPLVPPEVQERWTKKLRSVDLETFHLSQQQRGLADDPAVRPPTTKPRKTPPLGAPPVTPRPPDHADRRDRWNTDGKTLPGVKQPAAKEGS